jgi:hypothetical protein
MDLAVRTTASPAAIWVIVIVAVVLLAFWLIMVMVYATRPDPRLRRLAGVPGPALDGIQMAAGAPGTSAGAPTEAIPAQRAGPAGTPASAGTTAGGTTATGTAGPGAGDGQP